MPSHRELLRSMRSEMNNLPPITPTEKRILAAARRWQRERIWYQVANFESDASVKLWKMIEAADAAARKRKVRK